MLKTHIILSYHCFIKLTHINYKSNLADVRSKQWGYNAVKGLLKPGDTADLYIDNVSNPEGISERNNAASITTKDQSASDSRVSNSNQWGVTKCVHPSWIRDEKSLFDSIGSN
jgi:hypothetical protein